MPPLASQLVGPDATTLVVHLPIRVTDEVVGPLGDEVRGRLPQATGAALILNFAATQLINSIGITCLLSLEEALRSRGVPVLVVELRPGVQEFLKQLKLTARFQVFTTQGEAQAWIAARAK